MEEPQKVDIEQIQKRSGLPRRLCWAALRVLDQLGVLKLAQLEEPQVGIRFLLSGDSLGERLAAMAKPRKREFTDRLHRMLGPESHHKMVYMDERQMRNRLQISGKMLENGLKVLADEGILLHAMVRNEQMGRLLEPRYQKFSLTDKVILQHRDRLIKKLNYMIGYVQTKGCRSRYIRIYFGEQHVPQKCGKCDNCKKRNSRGVSPDDISKVAGLLKDGSLGFDALQERTHWGRAHLKSVLSSMMREEMISKVRDKGERYRIS